jgi:PAS domain S-box-containing protein
MIDWIAALKTAGVVASSLGSIWGGFKYIYKPINRKLKEQKKFKESCVVIAKEMLPNGGGSLRDKMEGLKVSIDHVLNTVVRLDQRQVSFANQSDTAIFETDAPGNTIFVNRAYCRLTGRTPDEVLGQGWKIIIHPEQREYVVDEWSSAVREMRDFDLTYDIIDTAGKLIKIHNHAYILRDIQSKTIGYMGFIRKVV